MLKALWLGGEASYSPFDRIIPVSYTHLDVYKRQLYRLRISHGDLKATNLLWHDGRVWLIDLDAMMQHRSDKAFSQAWRRDRARLLRNWPASSLLCQWLDANLPVDIELE